MNAVLLIAVPLLAAFLSILSKKIAPFLLIIVSFGLVILLTYIPVQDVMIGGFAAPYGIELVLDNYSLIAVYIIDVLFFLIMIINIEKFKQFSTILLVGLAGLNGLLLTGDLFNLFVFLEITGISAYLITTSNKKPLHTFHYLVAGTVGSSLYLLGLIILYSMFGTLNIKDMAVLLEDVDSMFVAFPFLLLFIGLGVEAKLLPFNAWVKGVLGHSNRFSGPMIASVYASATLFVFGRLLTSVFVMSDTLLLIVSIVIGISILAGEAMAFASTKGREILLFSSIAQAGIAVLVFTNGFTGYGVLFVGINGFSKMVLFLVMNTISDQTSTDEIEDLKGIFKNQLFVGIGFTVVTLSVLGLPLFAGFIVKVGILQELFLANNYVFPAIILISSVVEGVYFIKLLIALWYNNETPKVVSFSTPLIYLVSLVALLFIVFGLYFVPLHDIVKVLSVVRGVIV